MTIEDIPENNFYNSIQKNANVNANYNPDPNIKYNPDSYANYNPNPKQNINQQKRKNQIDYDDILRNMGMREVKGKLFWEKNTATTDENFVAYDPQQRKSKKVVEQIPPNNSYIYNKYFKNELKEQPLLQKPRNIIEYRNMLVRQIIDKKKVEQIKSRQMIFR